MPVDSVTHVRGITHVFGTPSMRPLYRNLHRVVIPTEQLLRREELAKLHEQLHQSDGAAA